MDIPQLLNIIGALSLLIYGLGSLLWPRVVGRLIEHELPTPRGVAEFRVVNGGYFIGLAGFALAVNTPLVYTALGIGWLGAALARLLAFVLDRPPLQPVYAGLLGFEAIMAVMMIV